MDEKLSTKNFTDEKHSRGETYERNIVVDEKHSAKNFTDEKHSTKGMLSW